MQSDLYIIAAGKGSRMATNIPKALVPITDEPCLTTTLQQIGHKFGNVFIVTNKLVEDQWKEYFLRLRAKYPELCKNLHNIAISSGLGDGHATLWGIVGARNEQPKKTEERYLLSDDIVVVWGDVFFPQAEIVDELLSMSMDHHCGLIPAVSESDPYVSLLVDDHMCCLSADFSKYGERHPTGFHDQSIFRFDRSVIWGALNTLHAAFWKNGRYITPGGELSLLHAFHFLYNSEASCRVYETDFKTLSFNTVEEVAEIQKAISARYVYVTSDSTTYVPYTSIITGTVSQTEGTVGHGG